MMVLVIMFVPLASDDTPDLVCALSLGAAKVTSCDPPHTDDSLIREGCGRNVGADGGRRWGRCVDWIRDPKIIAGWTIYGAIVSRTAEH